MPYAEVGGGRWHYQVRGEGPPLLGIMGWGMDQRFWAAQIPAVITTHSFITFDGAGVGRSSGRSPASIAAMASGVVELLDRLDVGATVVFGVSMGGAVAQRMALDHPERVSALVLGVTWARPIEFMRRQCEVARVIIEAGGPEALVQATLVWMFTPAFFEVGGAVVDQMLRAFFAETGPDLTPSEVLLSQLDAIAAHDTLAELGRVSCPTLVFGGRQDMMVPFFASEEIAAAIPGAQLAAFETGHALMVEEMDAINGRIARFLEELVAPSTERRE